MSIPEEDSIPSWQRVVPALAQSNATQIVHVADLTGGAFTTPVCPCCGTQAHEGGSMLAGKPDPATASYA